MEATDIEDLSQHFASLRLCTSSSTTTTTSALNMSNSPSSTAGTDGKRISTLPTVTVVRSPGSPYSTEETSPTTSPTKFVSVRYVSKIEPATPAIQAITPISVETEPPSVCRSPLQNDAVDVTAPITSETELPSVCSSPIQTDDVEVTTPTAIQAITLISVETEPPSVCLSPLQNDAVDVTAPITSETELPPVCSSPIQTDDAEVTTPTAIQVTTPTSVETELPSVCSSPLQITVDVTDLTSAEAEQTEVPPVPVCPSPLQAETYKDTGINIINLRNVGDVNEWIKSGEGKNEYIGRENDKCAGSKWGNPHRLRDHNNDREKVVDLFRADIMDNKNKKLLESVSELKDKVLGCWCSPQKCHGEVLHELAGNYPRYEPDSISSSANAPSNKVSPAKPIPSPQANSPTTLETLDVYATLCESHGSSLFEDSDRKSLTSTFSESPPSHQGDSPHSASLPLPNLSPTDEESEMDVIKRMLLFVVTRYDELTRDIKADISKTENRLVRTIDEKVSSIENKLKDSYQNKFEKIELGFKNYRNRIDFQTSMINYEAQKLRNESSKQWENHIEKFHTHVLREDEVSNIHPAVETRIEARLDELKIDFEKKIKVSNEENLKLILSMQELSESQPQTRLRSFSDECRNGPTMDLEGACYENTRNGPSMDHEETHDENTRNDRIDSDNFEHINKALHDLESRIMEADVRILECEQYSRRECVIISGIPENIKEGKLESTVIDILKKLEIVIYSSDISAIHRLGDSRDTRYPARVIVKFVNRKITNQCFERKEWLPDLRYELKMNVRFYESLAQLNQESLRLCYWLKQNDHIHDHFLRNGFSKIVIAENDKPTKVPHPQYLRDKFPIPVNVK